MVPLKSLLWIGSSRKDFSAMPREVKSDMGFVLYLAQQGGKHRAAKPLSGFGGAGVMEVVSDHRGDTFRCVYTTRIADTIYVLHAFQKKSKHGIETPKAEIEIIKRRLREVENFAKGEKR